MSDVRSEPWTAVRRHAAKLLVLVAALVLLGPARPQAIGAFHLNLAAMQLSKAHLSTPSPHVPEDAALRATRVRLLEALRWDDHNRRAHYWLGEDYYSQGRWEEAFAQWVRTGDGQTLYIKARTLAGEGHLARAITLYEAALAVAPNLEDTYLQLAGLYGQQGRWEDAVAIYSRAIERFPDRPQAYINLAGLYQSRGDTEQAMAVYQQGLERARFDEPVYYNLAVTYFYMGDLAKAEATVRTALNLDSRDGDAWGLLGNIFAARGDYAGAIEQYQRATQARQPVWHSYGHVRMGDTYLELGDVEAALREYRQAIAIEERRLSVVPAYYMADLYATLGNGLARAGQRQEAIAAYEKALTFDPQDEQARKALSRLQNE